ncbi:hypothetical protein GCM10017083_25230 [Thalassobaculum fulvum]|jgi:DNA-binding PadR family transcriptional regulator|uniref:AphA-like transcriptional regulator n=1 Tax=Thalassobaculum fulvum TaxID=1633335 RepID=A0A919CR07_9PROT|nr:hypothetical protein [Thalassobaculum fulvum]GHD51141.1 hypothetical protein GCM10017083_25230 [Thalassobaculum fulvum]
MYRDNSLVPKEAIRLAALGLLAEGDRAYGDLAREVREFASRIVGPSLDLLGTSIELLRFEGLIEPVEGHGMEDNAVLRLTASGRAALTDYLTSTIRPGVSDLNKLVLALKLRFVDLLSAEDREEQIAALEMMYAGEKARLEDLRARTDRDAGLLAEWLDLEIAQVDRRIAWCRDLIAS